MPALGSYAENIMLNAILRGSGTILPSAWYVCLYTTNPTGLDVGTEVAINSTTNYLRQPVSFTVPTSGSVSNTTDIVFPIAGSSWGTLTFAAIRDASTSGHLLFYGPLTTSRTIVQGDVLRFPIGSIVCSAT